jgi:hypothetical protein
MIVVLHSIACCLATSRQLRVAHQVEMHLGRKRAPSPWSFAYCMRVDALNCRKVEFSWHRARTFPDRCVALCQHCYKCKMAIKQKR